VYDIWAPVAWVHCAVLHREGSANREKGAVQDDGGQMNEMKQAKRARRGTKHNRGTRQSRQSVVRATNHPLSYSRSGVACICGISVGYMHACLSRAPGLAH
jgi:hypothetical protein